MTSSERRRRRAGFALAALLLSAASCGPPPTREFDLRESVRTGAFAIGPTAEGFSFGKTPRLGGLAIDSESRPVVLSSAEPWSWRGRLPRAAHLHVGVQLDPAAWREGPGLEVGLYLTSGSARETLGIGRAGPASPQRWIDLDADLDRWAGRKVVIEAVPTAAALPTGRRAGSVVAWGPVTMSGARDSAAGRPNVLFVVVDTMRADHLPAYGYERMTAPSIESVLARRGTVVERAYSQAPWTLPSVISYLTSRQPGEFLAASPETFVIPAPVETMAERFHALGYRTGGFLANPTLLPAIGFDRGFDTLYRPPAVIESLTLHADSVAPRARSWLEARQHQPFFLYLHLIDPHDPYDNPEIVNNRSPFETVPYTGKVAGTWVHGFYQGLLHLEDRDRDLAHLVALYDSEIHYADRFVGEVIAALRPDVLRNTLIVLTSDHGEELLDHGGWKHGQALYEEQIRVPLVFRWDGRIPAGKRLDGTVRLLDLLPTLNAAAGGVPDPSWEGTNLLPALLGEARVPRQIALSQGLSGGPLRAAAVADGRKVILFNRQSPFRPSDDLDAWLWKLDLKRLERVELYDLAHDPQERTNLAKADADAVRRGADAILRQLDVELPGLRLVISGAPGRRVSGSLRFDRAPSLWKPLFLAEEDRVSLEGDRLRFDLGGETPAKGILVEGTFTTLRDVEARLEGGDRLSVAWGEGHSYSGGDLLVERLRTPSFPPAPEGPALRLWIPRGKGTKPIDGGESQETVKSIRALGYVH